MTAPTSPGVVPSDDERIAFTQDGIFRLNEDSQDMLDQWHRERGMETSRAYWKKRALTAEATLADCANRPSLTEDEREQVRREALESEVERLRQVAHDLTNALVQIRPLGGSELYKRFDDQTYFAEPAYCAAAINALRDDVHMLRKDNVRLSRALADRSEPRQEKEGKA